MATSLFQTQSNAAPGYTRALKMFQEAAAQYAPGGGYTKGVEAMLARLMKKSTAAGMSNLVSSGLAGTSMAGGLANKFAEETGAPMLAQAESERAKALADTLMQAGRFAGEYGDRPYQTTQMAPMSSGPIMSAARPSTSVQQPTGYSGMTDRYGQPVTRATESNRLGTEIPQVQDFVPGASSDNQNQNWVTINGKKYVQDANGQWNIPLGLANQKQTLTQAAQAAQGTK